MKKEKELLFVGVFVSLGPGPTTANNYVPILNIFRIKGYRYVEGGNSGKKVIQVY